MTAISAIYDHCDLKLFATILLAYGWPALFSRPCLDARTLERRGKSGHWGASGGEQVEWISWLQSPVLTASSALTGVSISTHQMWTNVLIPELAQSIQLATIVLEATLVPATQDLNPAGERWVSRTWERFVKVGSWVSWGIKSNLFAKTPVVGEDLRWVSAEFKALICKAEVNNHSCIHSFNKHFLNTYYMPSTILGMEDAAVCNAGKNTCCHGTYHPVWGEIGNKQNTFMDILCVRDS